jgi:hypothetical protein
MMKAKDYKLKDKKVLDGMRGIAPKIMLGRHFQGLDGLKKTSVRGKVELLVDHNHQQSFMFLDTNVGLNQNFIFKLCHP